MRRSEKMTGRPRGAGLAHTTSSDRPASKETHQLDANLLPSQQMGACSSSGSSECDVGAEASSRQWPAPASAQPAVPPASRPRQAPTYVDVPKAARADLPAQPILALQSGEAQQGRRGGQRAVGRYTRVIFASRSGPIGGSPPPP